MRNGHCVIVTQSAGQHEIAFEQIASLQWKSLFPSSVSFTKLQHVHQCVPFDRPTISQCGLCIAFIFVIITNFTNLRNMLKRTLFRTWPIKVIHATSTLSHSPFNAAPNNIIRHTTNWETFLRHTLCERIRSSAGKRVRL